MEIIINNEKFNVEIVRKKIKNVYLKFNGVNNLLITCNKNVSEEYIDNFIRSKADWIIKNNKKLDDKTNYGYQNTVGGIFILGKRYTTKFYLAEKNLMFIDGDKVIFYLKKKDRKIVDKLINEYSKKYFETVIESFRIKNDLMLNDFGIYKYPEIEFKKLRGKWGFCVPTKNRIVISTTLIHYPISCFEYVLLHEYTHILVPNHSKKFYSILNKYMNDYKKQIEILKNR